MTVKIVRIHLSLLFAVTTVLTVISFGYAAGVFYLRRGLPMDGTGNASAKTAADLSAAVREHIRYLHAFGWSVDEEPVDITQITVPTDFDAVFSDYNALQRAQGFDLTPYKGETLDKYVYRVVNYPGLETDDTVRADILVFRGKIVGGDVCSVRLDGFLHGFQRETHGNDQTG